MAVETLDTEIATVEGGIIVTLRGSASMELCDKLNNTLLDACKKKPATLVLDLADLTFICSLGLGGLIAAYLRVKRYGGQMALVSPNEDILEMLNLTKLCTILMVYETAQEALANA